MNQTFIADESELICGCLSNEFFCNNTCLDIIHRCNTKNDCPDGSDEKNCETHVCPPSHFKCDDHFCVPNEQICNFESNCPDGSDEKNCSFRKCWFGEFRCNNGQCIRSHGVCNSKPDCLDSSDELHCSDDDFVDCGDNTKVHNSLKCDDWADCKLTHKDEINCKVCNETNQFKCPNGRCISTNLVCDGLCDCIPMENDICSDEKNCEKIYNRDNHFLNCSNSSLHCASPKISNSIYTGGLTHSEKCVQIEFICDKNVDCLSIGFGLSWPRSLDEFGCNTAKGTRYTEKECLSTNSSNVWCSEGRCLPGCNHFPECINGEDELNCNFKPCKLNEHMCLSGECIDKNKLCDSFIDCFSRDDELNCMNAVCNSTQFKCRSGGQCISNDRFCDFYLDCPDGSDEDPENCTNKGKECKEDEFRCKNNGQCIAKEHFCTYYGQNDHFGCIDESHLTRENCQNFTCGPNKFKCTDSYCVDIESQCDAFGNNICSLKRLIKNLEKNSSYKYRTDIRTFFKRNSFFHFCDGIIDCKNDWSDEELCPFQCSSETKCACIDITINCTFLNLENFPQNIEPEISRVILSHNRLNQSSLSLNTFKKLYRIQILDLGYNEIEELPEYGVFQPLWQLRVLNLKENKLKVLKNETFYGLANIRSLVLKGNQIEYIESFAFKGLSSLKILDLSHQKLVFVAKNAFRGLRVLINLDLSHNFLESLEYGSLNGLSSLKILDLSHNKFHVMEPSLFNSLNSLQTLKTDEFRFCCLVSISTNCLPKPDQFSSCEDLMSNGLLRICIWILGATSLCGNLIVIFWRLQYGKNRNFVHSFLIANLAIGDLLMGIYLLIIACVDAYYRGYCLVKFFNITAHIVLKKSTTKNSTNELSVFTLTFLTIDRYLAIVFPLRLKREFSQTVFIMLIIWVACLLLAILPVFKLNYFKHFYGRSGVCLALHITNERPNGWEYSVFVFLFLNFCSFTLIALAYVYMFLKARSTNRTDSSLNTTRYDSKVAKRILLIVSTDACCWLPIFVITIFSLIGYRTPNQVYAWICVFVLPFNAAVNRHGKKFNTAGRTAEEFPIPDEPSLSQRCSDELDMTNITNSNRPTSSSSNCESINPRFHQLETNYYQQPNKFKSNLLNRTINHNSRKALLIKNCKYNQSNNLDNNSIRRHQSLKTTETIKNRNLFYCLNVLSPRKQNLNLLNIRHLKYTTSIRLNQQYNRKNLRRTQSEYINKSKNQLPINRSKKNLSIESNKKITNKKDFTKSIEQFDIKKINKINKENIKLDYLDLDDDKFNDKKEYIDNLIEKKQTNQNDKIVMQEEDKEENEKEDMINKVNNIEINDIKLISASNETINSKLINKKTGNQLIENDENQFIPSSILKNDKDTNNNNNDKEI